MIIIFILKWIRLNRTQKGIKFDWVCVISETVEMNLHLANRRLIDDILPKFNNDLTLR